MIEIMLVWLSKKKKKKKKGNIHYMKKLEVSNKKHARLLTLHPGNK